MKTKIYYWCVAMTALALLATKAAPPPATAAQRPLSEIIDDAFVAGLQLGWSAAQIGATKEDVRFLAETKRRNDIGALKKWFAQHEAKP